MSDPRKVIANFDSLPPDHQRVMNGRGAFVAAYMQEKGWGTDETALTWDQIMEIRSQPGWKDPA